MELDNLITSMQVDFVNIAECVVGPGCSLAFQQADVVGLHYNLKGHGRLVVDGQAPIPLKPHTLVLVPPGHAFRIEVPLPSAPAADLSTTYAWGDPSRAVGAQKWVACHGAPELVLICGYFHATYGVAEQLFAGLDTPIVEQFEAADHVDDKLTAAMHESVTQEVGCGAVTTSLLKVVLVTVLRRALSSPNLWVESLATLKDPQIFRAFAEMSARPGAPHTVKSLAKVSALSRSQFMSRFQSAFGQSPMTTLRRLRMRRATALLRAGILPLDQVIFAVGYRSRSGFLRAYRTIFGSDADPSLGGG